MEPNLKLLLKVLIFFAAKRNDCSTFNLASIAQESEIFSSSLRTLITISDEEDISYDARDSNGFEQSVHPRNLAAFLQQNDVQGRDK